MTEGAAINCRYHSTTPARWRCRPCDLVLCTRCKPLAEQVPADVTCPLCSRVMADLGAGPPFWQAPYHHIRYLFQPAILIFIAALAVTGMIVPAGPLLAVFTIAAFLPASWYFFQVLFTSSRGEPAPPGFGQLKSLEQIGMYREFLGLTATHALLTAIAVLAGPPPIAVLVMLLVAVTYPAMIMVTAIDEKLRPALDPERVFGLARRIGPPYLALAGTVLALFTIPWLLLLPVGWIAPDWLHRGLWLLLQGYGMFLAMHLIGHVLFQFRRQLEYHEGIPVIDRERPPQPAEYEPGIALTDARIQTGEGHLDKARWTVGEALTRYPDHPKLNDHFEQLLSSTEGELALRNHVERRILRLTRRGDSDQAVEIWDRHRDELRDWMPRSSAARHRMGRELFRSGHPRRALKFLLSLPDHDPRYDYLPEACMLIAEILEVAMDDAEGAEKWRTFVRQRFPGRADEWEELGDLE